MKCRFVVSVDTEEDIWGWRSKAPVTCRNVRELPRLARFFRCLHIHPTFFVSHQVLSDPSARAIIQELAAEEGFEIGSHVHPWNTPPYDDSPRRTVLHNLPREVQASKIATVTRGLGELLGSSPSSFRAGRFGFGPATAACLLDLGYDVDSSVTPFFDWTGSSHGQSYVGAPLRIYRISPESGVLRENPNGRLVEVPLTSGYTRLRPDRWRMSARFFNRRVVQAMRLGAVGSLVMGFRRVILSPEAHEVRDMVALGSRALESGVDHLHLFFHSSSLVPGLTPFTRASQDVERLYHRIEAVLDELQRWCDFEFVSVAEAAMTLSSASSSISAKEPGSLSAVAPERSNGDVASDWKPRSFRWPEPMGTKARIARMVRYVYWRLGGYRRYRRVHWPSVNRLVFVCTGNICRSPYAEHVALSQGLEAASVGVNTNLDSVADRTALQVARVRGVPMDGHRTTPLGHFEPREGDLLVAMEPFQAAAVAEQPWGSAHQVTLLGLWSGSEGPVIPDPYGGDERRFHHCFSIIERGIARIERRLESAADSPIRESPWRAP